MAFAAYVLITYYPESGAGLVIPFAALAGMALASAGAWKDHPLLSDLNYWERVVFVTQNPRVIHDKRVTEEFEERVKQV